MDHFKRIGYFHFVSDYDQPVEALGNALARFHPDELRHTLLALPEGFNAGRFYGASPEKAPLDAKETLSRLRNEFAFPFGITFVVGILEDRRNRAYWVDQHSEPFVMCEKILDDHTGLYVPCEVEKADHRNPNKGVAAFICADARDMVAKAKDRRELVLSKSKVKEVYLVCTLARFNVYGPGPVPSTQGFWQVLAQGTNGCNSCVIDPENKIVVQSSSPNEIGVFTVQTTW